MDSLNINKFDVPLIFRSRPESIPGDLRPAWRIGVAILMLHLASRSQKASLGKIHILNWAIQSQDNQISLLKIIDGQLSPDTIIIRVEPSLNRALDLARGEGLIEYVSDKNVQLTSQGRVIASHIMEKTELFVNEKKFLTAIGKNNITEQFVSRLFSGGQ